MNWKDLLKQGLDVAKILAGRTPIGAILHVVDAVVESQDDGISTDSIKNFVTKSSKSKWNNLTPAKVDKINEILDSE